MDRKNQNKPAKSYLTFEDLIQAGPPFSSPPPIVDPFLNPPYNDLPPLGLENSSTPFGSPTAFSFNSSQPPPTMSMGFGTHSPFSSQQGPTMSMGFGTHSPFSSQQGPTMSMGFGTPPNSQSIANLSPFQEAFGHITPTFEGNSTSHFSEPLQNQRNLTFGVLGTAGFAYQQCPFFEIITSSPLPAMGASQERIPFHELIPNETAVRDGITTGSGNFDCLLGRGVKIGVLTGIIGEEDSGIMELCQMLCITTQLPVAMGGVDGGIIFMDMERNFKAETLLPVAERYGIPGREALDRIKYAAGFTVDQLNGFVNHEVPNMLSQSKYRLIIINGLLSCYRFGNEGICDFETLCRTLKSLKEIAAQSGVAVVCSTGYPGSRIIPSGGQVLTDQFSVWVNLKNYRENVKIAKLEQGVNGGNSVAFFKTIPSGIMDAHSN